MHVACFNLSSYFIKEESRTSLCWLVGCAQEDDASELNDGDKDIRKRLCQVCANLIDTSWHLVTQFATSVPISVIKTIGYGLDRSLFFVVGNTMGNKCRANRIKSSLSVIE